MSVKNMSVNKNVQLQTAELHSFISAIQSEWKKGVTRKVLVLSDGVKQMQMVIRERCGGQWSVWSIVYAIVVALLYALKLKKKKKNKWKSNPRGD